MLAWALIINNLGRRRYPVHWWAPGVTFVQKKPTENGQNQYAAMEEARIKQEKREQGELQRANITSEQDLEKAEEPEGRNAELDAQPADLHDAAHVTRRS